jgi:hypothetical protein
MSHLRFAAAILGMVLVCAAEGFSQAAAESVLTHSLGSGAASSLGKTLGKSVGSAAGNLGKNLGRQTTSTIPRRTPVYTSTGPAPRSNAASIEPLKPSNGSLIASIQGGEIQPEKCPAGKASEPGSSETTAANAPVTPVAGSCSAAEANVESHPAVVTLPAAR